MSDVMYPQCRPCKYNFVPLWISENVLFCTLRNSGLGHAILEGFYKCLIYFICG